MIDDNNNKELIRKLAKSVILSILIAMLLMLAYNFTIFSLVKIGGGNNEQAREIVGSMSISQQVSLLTHTPGMRDNILRDKDREQTKYIGTEKPLILIMYRVGCPDCEEAYPHLQKEINKLTSDEKNNVFWVPSRTETGSQFIEKYRIKEVPTLVLIDKKGDIEKTVIYDKDGTDIELLQDVFKTFRKEFYKS